MQGGDLDATLHQLEHEGAYLIFGKNEITHEHYAVFGRLEGDPATQCQRRFDRHAV